VSTGERPSLSLFYSYQAHRRFSCHASRHFAFVSLHRAWPAYIKDFDLKVVGYVISN
jgi:hypothetical protein